MRRANIFLHLFLFALAGCAQILVPDPETYGPRRENESGGQAGAAGGPIAGAGGAGGSGGNGAVGGSGGGSVPCQTEADCPEPPNECVQAACAENNCKFNPVAAGTMTSQQVPHDCRQSQCNGAGEIEPVPDDSDVPDDGNDCTDDSCNNGVPMQLPTAINAKCGLGKQTFCDGMGNCVGCIDSIDCSGSDEACRVGTCIAQICKVEILPAGTVLALQSLNDCLEAQCDGSGAVILVNDDADLPIDDGNDCLDHLCSGGMALVQPSLLGTICNQNGGRVCNGNAQCVECNVNADCASGHCEANICQAAQVLALAPADMDADAAVYSPLVVTFSGAMNAGTIIGQTTIGPCSGSVQLSSDDFLTCLPFDSAVPMMSIDGKKATFTPSPGFSYGTKYRAKVTTAVIDLSGKPLASDYLQTVGFTTEITQSTCAGSVVISQIYSAGGASGAAYLNDFVELHNRSHQSVSVTGWSLQYASQNGTTWQGPTLNGSIPAGGYYLVQFGSGGANGLPLPTPNLTNGTALSAASGKLALVSNSVLLSGGCPSSPQIRDFVGYGATGCFEGANAAATPGNTQAIFRKSAGCTDTGQNGVDTELLAASPRNGGSAPSQCACPIATNNGTANESDTVVEMDFCNVSSPPEVIVGAGQVTPVIYGRVNEAGLTETMGANALVIAELGYGPVGVNPENQSGYQFFPAAFTMQVGNDDEYGATMAAPPVPGSYRFVYRFTRNGLSWTYCDKNGAGSNPGLSFEVQELPSLVVMP